MVHLSWLFRRSRMALRILGPISNANQIVYHKAEIALLQKKLATSEAAEKVAREALRVAKNANPLIETSLLPEYEPMCKARYEACKIRSWIEDEKAQLQLLLSKSATQ